MCFDKEGQNWTKLRTKSRSVCGQNPPDKTLSKERGLLFCPGVVVLPDNAQGFVQYLFQFFLKGMGIAKEHLHVGNQGTGVGPKGGGGRTLADRPSPGGMVGWFLAFGSWRVIERLVLEMADHWAGSA